MDIIAFHQRNAHVFFCHHVSVAMCPSSGGRGNIGISYGDGFVCWMLLGGKRSLGWAVYHVSAANANSKPHSRQKEWIF